MTLRGTAATWWSPSFTKTANPQIVHHLQNLCGLDTTSFILGPHEVQRFPGMGQHTISHQRPRQQFHVLRRRAHQTRRDVGEPHGVRNFRSVLRDVQRNRLEEPLVYGSFLPKSIAKAPFHNLATSGQHITVPSQLPVPRARSVS
jgi:hypothetical protein